MRHDPSVGYEDSYERDANRAHYLEVERLVHERLSRMPWEDADRQHHGGYTYDIKLRYDDSEPHRYPVVKEDYWIQSRRGREVARGHRMYVVAYMGGDTSGYASLFFYVDEGAHDISVFRSEEWPDEGDHSQLPGYGLPDEPRETQWYELETLLRTGSLSGGSPATPLREVC